MNKKLFMTLAVLMSLIPITVKAEAGNRQIAEHWSRDDGNAITRTSNIYSIDWDDNGSNDTTVIKTSIAEYYSLKGITVTVNGKTALSVKGGKYDMGVSYEYLRMGKGKNFLWVHGWGEDEESSDTNCIYRYDKASGKFTEAADLAVLNGANTSINKVSSKTVSLKVYSQFLEPGQVSYPVKYKYNKGKLKLISKSVSVKSMYSKHGNKYDKYFSKNKYVTRKPLPLYEKPGSKKKTFTAKKGTILTLKKIYIGKTVYFKFTKGKKAGWIRGSNNWDKKSPFCDMENRYAA